MAKKHKKKHHGDHIDESWLIPYADLLTLLLALFIVLFSMSEIDARKFEQMSAAFQSAFNGGTGVMQFQNPVQQKNPTPMNQDKKGQSQGEQEDLEKLQEKVNGYIEQNDLNLSLQTTLNDEGLLITILNDILFDSGSAEIRPEDQKIVYAISNLLMNEEPRNIIISGHTDNVPIKNQNFESNWHLSVMRSVNFMEILLKNPKINPRLLSAKGYGEYKPVANNSTPEGRNKNRRVEILIVPNITPTENK